jgi:hypothetical protein
MRPKVSQTPMRGDQGQQFRIVCDERAAEIAGSEDQRVARRAISSCVVTMKHSWMAWAPNASLIRQRAEISHGALTRRPLWI